MQAAWEAVRVVLHERSYERMGAANWVAESAVYEWGSSSSWAASVPGRESGLWDTRLGLGRRFA
jgi:hypothetical protein